ncbi:MAG: PH domain-containing protein [Marmoricola sp.]
MAIRDKMAKNAQPHLREGETIQAVFAAQTTSQYLMVVGVLPFIIVNSYRMITVTDQRIIVFDAGKWGMTKAKSIAYELPRATKLGPGTGLWYRFDAASEKLRAHRRFFSDIAEADRLSGAA